MDHNNSAEPEILRVDPKWRLAMLGLLAIAFVAGGFLIWVFRRRIAAAEALAVDSPQEAAIGVLRLAGAQINLLGAGLAVLGLYFLVLGFRTARARQFPPPGTKVLRDTRLLRGALARRRAVGACVIGVLLVALGLVMPRLVLERLEIALYPALAGELEPEPIEYDPDVGIAPRSPR